MNQINNSKKIYHAAIYVRLSKEDGDVATAGKRESNSISNQKDLIKNFLKDKKDIVVVSERVDDGYSGSNFERPAFQMMLEDIKKGIVDCVVVKDLSRFGREYIDAGKYIERLFPALGVRFIAVNDHYDSLEGKSQADEIVIPFKNLINDAYCRDISIKIRSHEEKVYPLSGLVVCGDCGAMMIKRDVPAGGKVYAYYICSRHAATKACAAHRIPMGKLEETVLELVKIHIENILDMKKIMDFIHEVPFQELDIKELEIRKEAKEKEAVRCRELRDYLYEDFREGIISKEDYKELHDGYTEKRKKAEEAVRSIDQQISEVLESKSDKYHWLDYFAEHQNIQELTRTVAVELIDQILVYDKKHIEVRFNFDDCYQSLLRQIQSVGCDVSTGMDGRIEIQKREVV